jgi:hypothetical protein
MGAGAVAVGELRDVVRAVTAGECREQAGGKGERAGGECGGRRMRMRVGCQTSWLDVVVGGLRLAFRLSVWRDSGPSTCIYTGPLVPAILIRSSTSHRL